MEERIQPCRLTDPGWNPVGKRGVDLVSNLEKQKINLAPLLSLDSKINS
jgi:hypothetical protein